MSRTSAARKTLPLFTHAQAAELKPELREVIEYRKSGLSLNHVVGCPLDCGYCVRHLFDNFAMKTPRALMSDEDAVTALTTHRYFQPGRTPLQLFNRATDPMLPGVKPHTLHVLSLLDAKGLTNHVLVITRWRVTPDDCAALNSFRHIKLTVLVTHSGITDERIEPVDSSIAAASLRTLHAHADNYRTILYWRPLVPGLNDTDAHLERARELSRCAHATVFTGLFYRRQIADYYTAHGLPTPYEDTARRKILPAQAEQRVLAAFHQPRDAAAPYGALFRKTSCAVAYAHGEADYNGHYGIRELCDICPATQTDRCATAHRHPDMTEVNRQARQLGATAPAELTERAIIVEGLDEPPRYYLQHTHGYQVHDRAKPHHPHRHGRADIGWPTEEEGP
ncbi:radical SAM protein [Streptomyces daliensis]|uniref:Radical SAM protein n=1 Tax=Streptomyces daliensis TaxID=299421 RepID=A0A8T4IY43_9ACTN|nr:radical SAM protein [Streptomyces daliensis]